MNTQPEALRLADALDPLTRQSLDNLTCAVAAAELRRQHEELKATERQVEILTDELSKCSKANTELLEALKEIADGATSEFEDAWCGEIARAAIAKHSKEQE